jgi:hypothetical protein
MSTDQVLYGMNNANAIKLLFNLVCFYKNVKYKLENKGYIASEYLSEIPFRVRIY